MRTTEEWLEHPQFVCNNLPWSLSFYVCSLLMYKKLCPLRYDSSVVDAEGDQDNLFIPCSGRVFSKEDKSMTAPSPFSLSGLDLLQNNTSTQIYVQDA